MFNEIYLGRIQLLLLKVIVMITKMKKYAEELRAILKEDGSTHLLNGNSSCLSLKMLMTTLSFGDQSVHTWTVQFLRYLSRNSSTLVRVINWKKCKSGQCVTGNWFGTTWRDNVKRAKTITECRTGKRFQIWTTPNLLRKIVMLQPILNYPRIHRKSAA